MSFLLKLIKINTVQVLGIFKTPEKDIYYSLQVRKKGGKINFSSSLTADNTDEIVSKLDLNKPVILVVDGKGILNRKINEKDETDINWKKNIDFKTIYSTEIKSNNFSFISFCRKKTADEYIYLLQKKGVQIIDFYLGPLPAVFLYPVLKEQMLYANDSILEFKDNDIYEVTKGLATNKEYEFNEQRLSNYHLPLYGVAIDYFLKLPQVTKTLPEGFNSEEIIYKKGFEFFGKAMLIFYLAALLVSYILIGHYSSDNIKLNQQNVFSGQTLKHIQDLQDKKEQKLLLLNKTGYLSSHFLNYYTYELSKSIPPEIELNRLHIFPVEKEVKENKKIEVRSDIIICNGLTASETIFNQWLNSLKQMKWIKKFEIVSLKKDKKNLQHFEIKILINNV